MTIAELNEKLELFSTLVNEYSAENNSTRETKVLQRELNEHFKYTTFKNEEEKTAVKSRFNELVNNWKEKHQQVNTENEKFAEEMETEVEKINQLIGEESSEKSFTKEDFAGIKKLVNELMGRFRQNRFPSRERKDAAWERFNNYRDRLKKAEDLYYEKQREEKQKQTAVSGELSEKIIPAIETCHPDVPSENMSDRISKFLSFVNSPEFKVTGFEFLSKKENENGEDKKNNPLLSKSETLRALRKFINENRESISRDDRNKIQFVVEEVQTDLDKAWTLHKDELQKKREAWEEKKKENDEKRKEWEVKQREFLTKLEDRLTNQTSFKAKLETVYQKQISFQERLEKRMTDQLAFLEKMNIQADGLEDKYNSARTDQFRETVQEWIEEKKAKIADVEDDIADMEDKLKDVKTKTEDLSDKIRDLEVSKADIAKKIEEVKKNLSRVNRPDKTTA